MLDETGGLGFKVVDGENVLRPDPLMEALATMDATGIRPILETDFARTFAKIEIDAGVPLEARRGFLFARNAMCYGYWCYGLMTLGMQQMMRVADDALAHAVRERGYAKRMSFADRIRKLIALGDIPADDEARWNALRNLRNSATHQTFQQIASPGQAAQMASTVAALLARVAWHTPATMSESEHG